MSIKQCLKMDDYINFYNYRNYCLAHSLKINSASSLFKYYAENKKATA